MNRGGRTRMLRLSASATVLIVAATVLCVAWAVVASGRGPAAEAMRSPTAIIFGAAALGSLLILYVLSGLLWRLGRGRGRLAETSESGTAAVEFALLFPIALMIVLIMIQSAMVLSANLVVHHAGYTAARAAITWVPEKLSYDEPRNVVAGRGQSEKLDRIRAAAVYKLLAISASRRGAAGAAAGDSTVIQEGMARFYELYGEEVPGWISNMLPAKYEYAWEHTEVTLHPPANGQIYGDNEELRVWLRHTVYLSVPYANRIFALVGAARGLPRGGFGTDVEVTYTLTNQGVEDEIDVEQFPRYVGRGG